MGKIYLVMEHKGKKFIKINNSVWQLNQYYFNKKEDDL